VKQFIERLWTYRTPILALLLIFCLLAPQSARAQFGIDWAPVIAAINSIGAAISNVIAPALRAINGALGALNGILNALHTFFQTVVYPPSAIARAQSLVATVNALYANIRAIATINVASATLPGPRSFETILLSRNPLNIPTVTTQFQTIYQNVPAATKASPQQRDMMDITDAAAQDAFKRSVALDAIADTEMQAADRINTELQSAAPGTAPMIEAEAAAWLVRSNAYTQSALSDVIRIRAIALANNSAVMKFNAARAAEARQNSLSSYK
jgi:hypothetical protein